MDFARRLDASPGVFVFLGRLPFHGNPGEDEKPFREVFPERRGFSLPFQAIFAIPAARGA
jgi:hypothetical protein